MSEPRPVPPAAFPVAPPTPYYVQPPSKARAGWALGLAIAGCCGVGLVIAVILALVVLKDSREDGRDHGRGLAYAALAISWLQVLSSVVGLVLYLGLDLRGLEETKVAAHSDNADPAIVAHWDLDPGQCLTDSAFDSRRPGILREAPCGRPHDAEVTGVVEVPGKEFPGAGPLHRRGEQCIREFEEYVGVPLAESELASSYYHPIAASWPIPSARVITCIVHDPSGRVTGTLANARR